MRLLCAAAVLLTASGCGDKSKPAGGGRPRTTASSCSTARPGSRWSRTTARRTKTAFITQSGKLFALDIATGAIAKSFDLQSERHGVWKDRVLVLVSARESRSDSDFGDAAVYAVDAPSLQVVLKDELGKDVPGGQQASDPVFDGDMAFAIAGGRVHAYRITAPP